MRRAGTVLRLGFLVLACLFALLPIIWGLLTSFKTPAEISAFPPTWLPDRWTVENYREGVLNARFGQQVLNTVLVVAVSALLSLGLATHAAYAATRMRLRGRNAMMLAMWATIMVPGVAVIVPLYLVSIDVGLYDTLALLVLVYSAWLVPTLVWLLRGFIADLPQELEEAAQVDGCTRAGAFYRVVLPLLRPGLLAGAVLVFTTIWNEFLIGYSLVLSTESRLVQVGIYYFVTEVGIKWGPLTAAAMAAIAPVLVAYALLQRSFIQGLSAGAVKG